MHLHRSRLLLAVAGIALLAGCASFSPDGGMGRVEAIAEERLGVKPSRMTGQADTARLAQQVERLLAATLTVEAAVQVALINNRGYRPVSPS